LAQKLFLNYKIILLSSVIQNSLESTATITYTVSKNVCRYVGRLLSFYGILYLQLSSERTKKLALGILLGLTSNGFDALNPFRIIFYSEKYQMKGLKGRWIWENFLSEKDWNGLCL
jgi:hypothetical protein